MNAPDLIKQYWDNIGELQPEVRRSPRLKKPTITANVNNMKKEEPKPSTNNMKTSNATGVKTFPKPVHQEKITKINMKKEEPRNNNNMKNMNAAGVKTLHKPAPEEQKKKITPAPKATSTNKQNGGDCKITESRNPKKTKEQTAYAICKHDLRPSKTTHARETTNNFTHTLHETTDTTPQVKPHTLKTTIYLPRHKT